MPQVLGTAIYVALRSPRLQLVMWISTWKGSEMVDRLRAFTAGLRSRSPEWVVYSVPDGLWCYAATAASLLLWIDVVDRPSSRLLLVSLGLLAACGLEVFQATGVIAGTGDPLDVVCAIAGATAAWLTVGQSVRRRPTSRKET